MKRIFLISIATLILIAIGVLTLTGNSGKVFFKKKNTTTQVELQAGDVLFQDLPGPFGEAIKLATGSKYSHCAIVLQDRTGLFVFEAVEPVRRVSIEEWIGQGTNDHYVVRRLSNAKEVLTQEVIKKMLSVSKEQLGKHYDGLFEWNVERIYCSELVWMAYSEGAGIELCSPRPLKEYDLSSPEVKAQIEMRYGRTAPMDELMVSPEDILVSEILIPVILNAVQLR